MTTGNMHGKRCVVTGATSGIGEATAVALANAGAELTLVCRSRARADATCEAIRRVAPDARVDLVLADLSSQAEVRAAAARLLEDPRPIDVLLNNAGVTHLKYTTTVDGIETSFAVNHLAYFLLTLLLLDRIREKTPARIVNVASHAHRFSRMDFDNLNHESDFAWMKVYGQSKLANILFSFELSRRLEGTGITVNCLHPGGVRTRLGAHNAPRIHRWLMWLATPVLRSPEQGARTSVHLASSPKVAGVSGEYFANCKPASSSKESRDPEVAEQLWEISERLTGLA
jgi:NAD(P)-dependent dehydrogenase (short-subunit alcohol dehydrogenase family)